AIEHGVEIVLAGSVRDDGPLPDVITDMIEAQRRMRAALKGVRIALMLSTMLHSIATGNMLPAGVRTVCVDINPAVVTKLPDHGISPRAVFAAIGFLGGLLGGLLGVGGGFVLVPLQVLWTNTPQRNANANSLVAIVPIAVAALPIYYFRKGSPQIDFHVALFLVI